MTLRDDDPVMIAFGWALIAGSWLWWLVTLPIVGLANIVAWCMKEID